MFLFSSSYCIIAAYCQNAGIPNFGCQQPGNTYYYSPLAMYCFGICDASAVPEELNAFGYTEDQGLKGGNNVASLLLYALEKFGWLVEGEPAAQLVIIMDNCSGQNKNRQVLRLALLLVELQYFPV